jgi:rhodanese-related sulfurtransferase
MRFILSTVALLACYAALAQAPADPWKKEQLVKPAQLAEEIKTAPVKPLIYNVGPMGQIQGAVKVGAVSDPKGLQAFNQAIDNLTDKSKPVVVYCGCCTSQNCPNIRPAFQALRDKGFKNVRVLEIEHGYVEDWQGKGYPID